MDEVNCQIAEASIPVALCYQEQGTAACAGCMAVSRRCPECKRAGNMGEAKEGVCKDCLAKLRSKAGDARPSLPGGNVADALEETLDGLEDIAYGDTSAISGGDESHPDAVRDLDTDALKKSRRAQDAGFLLAHLGPFIVERPDGSRLVTAAHAVLMEQARLMPDETSRAIELLVSRGLVERRGESDLIILTREIPQLASQSSAAGFTGGAPKLTPLRLTGRVDDAKGRQIPTIEEIYAALEGRHRVVGEERLVTGAVPILQLELHVGAPVAIRMLERLQEETLVKPKDGWRTLVLLGEGEVHDSRAALKEETIIRMERSAAKARLIIRKGVLTKFAFVRALQALDESISELEAIGVQVASQVTALRAHREEVRQAELGYDEARAQSENAVEMTNPLAASQRPPDA